MFDWEHGIALHAMKGNQASSLGKGTSHGFLELWWEPGYILELRGDCHSKLEFVQQSQDSYLVTTNTSGI